MTTQWPTVHGTSQRKLLASTDLGVVDAGPGVVTLPHACSIIMDMFQLMQPDDVSLER